MLHDDTGKFIGLCITIFILIILGAGIGLGYLIFK